MNRLPRFDLDRFGSRLGLAVAGVGLLLIGLGWNGAASNDSVVEQLPFVVSGGLLGLALVIVGAAHVLALNARQDAMRLEAKLDQLAEVMATASSSAPGGAAPRDVSGLVVAGTASYHLPTCRLVDGRESATYLTPGEALDRGLNPCRVCKPAATVDAPPVTIA